MNERKWRRRDILWPPVETEQMARIARLGFLPLACFYAFWWTLYAVMGLFVRSSYGLHWLIFYAVLWDLISWGLYKMRPEAAIAGFILSAVILFMYHGILNLITSILLIFTAIHAIRGTFAYQRIFKQNMTS